MEKSLMITKQQAINEREFHIPSSKDPNKCHTWRRNGSTQTWVTRPDNFRVPVKFGMYDYNQITQEDAHKFHIPADCPHKS